MPDWLGRKRFDICEVVLVCAFVAFGLWAFSRTYEPEPKEGAWLRDKYGPHRHSEHWEEWIIRDFFADRRGGVFVDVGANHYEKLSNTYYLEHDLGWSGIAIEPQRQFEDGYLRFRPRTRFFSYFVSDVSDAETPFYSVEGNDSVSSGLKEFTGSKPGTRVRETSVPTIRLTDLLNRQKVGRIDLLSIDVELSEPKVLAGLDVGRFRPELVCIEAHRPVRQQILDYFSRRGYVVVGRYLRADPANLYFMPLP